MHLMLNSVCVCVYLCVTDGGSLLQRVFEGDFEAVLLSVPVLEMFSGDPDLDESIEAYLQKHILTYLRTTEEETKRDR